MRKVDVSGITRSICQERNQGILPKTAGDEDGKDVEEIGWLEQGSAEQERKCRAAQKPGSSWNGNGEKGQTGHQVTPVPPAPGLNWGSLELQKGG